MLLNETDLKIPINRLPNGRTLQDRGIRTVRACDSCRQRKWKCDGKRPMCTRCQCLDLEGCVYSEPKRLAERKKLESSLFKVEVYEELLRDISRDVNVDTPLASRISRALEGCFPDPTTVERPDSPSSDSTSSFESLRDMDSVNEDLNRSEASRATGYIGKNSEVAWMQQLVSGATKEVSALRDQRDDQHHQLPVEDSIASTNYHLDDERLSEPDVEDIFSLPSKALADQLLQTYIGQVHFSLPIIRQNLFIKQYKRVFSGHLLNPGRKWLAVLNMIFAIGSQLHRLSQRLATNGDDEKVFFARAKSLNISDNALYDHADLQQIQAEALMAFYLLNLSWKVIGVAIRSAIALGLNLRIKNTQMDIEANEARKRLWWSIFYLEHILSMLTGRVSYLGDGCCAIGPPLPLVDLDSLLPDLGDSEYDPPAQFYDIQRSIHLRHEQILHQQMLLKATEASASTYFFYLVDLISIVQAFTNRVYSANTLQEGWAQTGSRISLYNKKLDQWASGLHHCFAFEEPFGRSLSATGSHGQISLALHYYSGRILLNRPCLSRPKTDQRSGTRFSRSRFSNEAALACLRASLALIAVLPNQPDIYWAHDVALQWCLLHFLVQSTTVLLLQMSTGPVPVRVPEGAAAEISAGSPGTNESPDIVLASVKKALCWLHCLGITDESARRAFELCYSSARRIALGKDYDLAGIPYPTAPAPSNVYNPRKQQPSLSDLTTGLPPLYQDLDSRDQQTSQSINTNGERRHHLLFYQLTDAETSSVVVDGDVDMSDRIL
ncbi:unnamed protein product [Penicillium olsonii]|nr:unnamed protein product [Penicillium olsonii]